MTRKHWRIALCAVAALAIAAGVWVATHPAEGSRGLLYRVTGGKAELYLLGSIHVGSRDMYPFGDAIREAMAGADTFVFECDTDSAEAVAQMKVRMTLPEGQTLAGALGEPLYGQLQQVAQALGIGMETLDGLKPWAVVNVLAVHSTAAAMGSRNIADAMALGVEQEVRAYVRSNQRATAYLETLGEQVDVLESFSDGLVRYLLQSECDVILHPGNAHGMDASIGSWPQWWREGAQEAFAQQYLQTYRETGYEAEGEEYHRLLVTQRNARMAERLRPLLESEGRYFVTVGLLHLVLPEDSVITNLQKMGYTVERIR